MLLARMMTVGSDTMWLVALGDQILDSGSIPNGVPFAEADSSGWVNVPVLGELVLAGVNRVGVLGLPALQLAIGATLLALLTLGARRLCASDVGAAIVLALVGFGAVTTLAVVRAQMLTLIPFALLLLLLRSETTRPSRRVWLLVPLVAVWANLHGGVLAGVAVAGCYLAVSRFPIEPWVAVGVGVCTVAAVGATPAGVHTLSYYVAVLNNEAAQQGSELWAPVRFTNPFDVLMVSIAGLLGLLALARRLPRWEYVALAGLMLATLTAARHGVWLLLFLAAPAAAHITRLAPTLMGRTARGPHLTWLLGVPLAIVTAMLVTLTLSGRAEAFTADKRLAHAVRDVVGDGVVLAPEPLAESLAASGVRVWMSNPLDAFSRGDQSAYLAFVSGDLANAKKALEATEFVVAETGSAQAVLATRTGFVVKLQIDGHVVMSRQDVGPGTHR